MSDVHLGINAKLPGVNQEEILISFFNQIEIESTLHSSETKSELFIVGDLFDCWIEYKYVIPKGYYKLFTKIDELIRKGIKITYLAGNHDFWRGKYFKEEFGIDIKFNDIDTVIENKKFYISHGDGLAYKDLGYKILKKIFRNKISQKLYYLIHPDLGIWLAKNTSSTSREYTSKKDYSKRDGLRDFALKKIQEGFDYVILGHRHKPEIVKKENSYYINLGDWIDDFTYGCFKNSEFKLYRYYDINTKKIINSEILC
ncbi:MAG: UDP-2,3-diacylglucosamine diphosphatase [Ignavibacteria bacterium]|nr:UDP-2,3-diacylglucosamine diphosphatase [Ignavibacteria bacterium]